MDKSQIESQRFGDRLNPKSAEEVIYRRWMMTGDALTLGKEEFMRAVIAFHIDTVSIHSDEYLKDVADIEKQRDEEILKINPQFQDKIEGLRFRASVAIAERIVRLLGQRGIRPVPYVNMVIE